MKWAGNYILLDAAKMQYSFFEARKLNSSFDSLYIGNKEEEINDVAPHLFTFSENQKFSTWFFENGWGSSWGIIFSSHWNFEECRRHFRKFLLVKTELGQQLYFRFYDPRVLKVFLPTCDKDQILEFFGPIESFIVEGETKEKALRFWQANGELKQEVLPVEEVFGKGIQKNEA